jgi:hypothetical protein
VLKPFPDSGCLGVFEADHVRIETDDGTVILDRRLIGGGGLIKDHFARRLFLQPKISNGRVKAGE